MVKLDSALDRNRAAWATSAGSANRPSGWAARSAVADLGQRPAAGPARQPGLVQRGGDRARADDVDPDAVAGMVQRQRPAEHQQPALAGAVGRPAAVGGEGVRRAGDDHRPAAGRGQLRDAELGQQEGAGEVDGQHPVPLFQRHLGHRLGHADPGVGPEQVEPAERGHGGADRAGHVIRARRVARHELGPAAPGVDRLGDPVPLGGVHVDQDQGRSLGGEQFRTRRADAAGRAGDQPDPARAAARVAVRAAARAVIRAVVRAPGSPARHPPACPSGHRSARTPAAPGASSPLCRPP